MKRSDDPVQLKLQKERDRARFRLEVLTKGIGHALAEDGRYGDVEDDLDHILEMVNVDLAHAVKAVVTATEAYRPYMRRLRRRYYVVPKKKNPKPKTVVQ